MGDFNWSSLFGAVGGIGDMIYNIVRDQSLTGAQREQNQWNADEAQKARDHSSAEAQKTRDFNASESALQRDWSSQEAERARDWNEEMYAKYNSLSGKISQAREAGVNPMFAVTGSAVSPMSTSAAAPSGSSAAAGNPSSPAAGGSASGGIAGALQLAKIFLGFKDALASIDVKESEADKNRSQAGSFDAAAQKSLAEGLEANARTLKVNEETRWLAPYNQALIDKINSEKGLIDAEKLSEEMTRQYIEVQKENVSTQTKHAKINLWLDNIFKAAGLILQGLDIFTWKDVMSNFKSGVKKSGVDIDPKTMEFIDQFTDVNTYF